MRGCVASEGDETKISPTTMEYQWIAGEKFCEKLKTELKRRKWWQNWVKEKVATYDIGTQPTRSVPTTAAHYASVRHPPH
jgi:hypothetical protein